MHSWQQSSSFKITGCLKEQKQCQKATVKCTVHKNCSHRSAAEEISVWHNAVVECYHFLQRTNKNEKAFTCGHFSFQSPVRLYWLLKAAFHYSSQLQTLFSTRFAARFSTSSHGFVTRFRLFCWKPGRKLQQVRWLARMLDKWNVKNPFKQVHSWLSTLRPGLQLARIMECGPKAAV